MTSIPRAAKRRGVGADVGWVGGAAEGQDRRMLEEQQLVADPSLRALGDEALLELERLVVVHPSEPRGDDRPRVGGRSARHRLPVSRSPPRQGSRTGRSGRLGPDRASQAQRDDRGQAPEPDHDGHRETDGDRPPARLAQLPDVDRHADGRERDQDQAARDRVERVRLIARRSSRRSAGSRARGSRGRTTGRRGGSRAAPAPGGPDAVRRCPRVPPTRRRSGTGAVPSGRCG